MKSFLRILVAVALGATLTVSPKQPTGKTASSLKKEKQATTREIKETTKKIKENTQSTARQLNRLEQLRHDIDEQRSLITRLQMSVDSLNASMNAITDSISAIEADVERLRNAYKKVLQRIQSRQSSMSRLTFIFSSHSFSEAVARVRYLRQFSKWRAKRTDELRARNEELSRTRDRLATLLGERNTHLASLNAANARMEKDRKETASILATLKSEGSRLRAHLSKQKERLASLDRELDRIIAEQQRRAAEEKKKREQERRRRQQHQPAKPGKTGPAKPSEPVLADNAPSSDSHFARLKGQLPFPLDGKYRIISQFGRHPHPDVPGIMTDNPGIDVEVLSGGNAKAIYNGEVSAVFRQPGYNHIVMVRHGEYIAIYAGLSGLKVKKGDKVKPGQTLGTVDRDPERDNRLILHFELRHERTKLNPLAWVR